MGSTEGDDNDMGEADDDSDRDGTGDRSGGGGITPHLLSGGGNRNGNGNGLGNGGRAVELSSTQWSHAASACAAVVAAIDDIFHGDPPPAYLMILYTLSSVPLSLLQSMTSCPLR